MTGILFCYNVDYKIMGMIFDIKEFSVHDGPGVRQTVFLKGCPLRCLWCHNPEGQNPEKEILIKNTLERKEWPCGEEISADELVERIMHNSEEYTLMKGGVTFSGGEPLMQGDFLIEVLNKLDGIHTVIETSCYGPEDIFRRVADKADLMMCDIKLMDDTLHREYTGVSNEIILKNIEWMKHQKKSFIVRIPMIPGITDTESNIKAAAAFLSDAYNLEYCELLSYNTLAGAKYSWLNRTYELVVDNDRHTNPADIVKSCGNIKWKIDAPV